VGEEERRRSGPPEAEARWKAVLLHLLFDKPNRLSELSRIRPEISQKVLIQQLREMEQHGLVHREVFREVPPRVEYTSTPLGRSLEPVLLALCAWGRQHAAVLEELDRLRDCSVPQRAVDSRRSERRAILREN